MGVFPGPGSYLRCRGPNKHLHGKSTKREKHTNLPVRSKEHIRVHELGVEPARLVRVVVHDRHYLPLRPQQLPEHGHVVVELQQPPVVVPLVDHQPLLPALSLPSPRVASIFRHGCWRTSIERGGEGRGAGGRRRAWGVG